MEPKDTTSKVEEQGQSKLIASNNQLRNLKSDYLGTMHIQQSTA